MRESKFKIEFMSEEQNEAFIVLSKEYMENLELKTNCKDTPCMFALEKLRVIKPERFASEYCLQFGAEMNGVDFSKGVKEDKMEEIRVVRKLEDLCNMGNGMGLYIDSNLDVRLKDKKTQICCGSDFVNTNLGVYLEVLKSMGFKFEYKPLRTEQEVKREILSLESLHFAQEKPNYYVGYNNLIDKYLVICDSVNGHGLHIYMTEEQAKKYADELNEIIGVGK